MQVRKDAKALAPFPHHAERDFTRSEWERLAKAAARKKPDCKKAAASPDKEATAPVQGTEASANPAFTTEDGTAGDKLPGSAGSFDMHRVETKFNNAWEAKAKKQKAAQVAEKEQDDFEKQGTRVTYSKI